MKLLLTCDLHFNLVWFDWLEAQAAHFDPAADEESVEEDEDSSGKKREQENRLRIGIRYRPQNRPGARRSSGGLTPCR